MKNKLIIGITNCNKWERYENWIKWNDDTIDVIRLSYHDNNAKDAERCDGIVMTGGQDVHPRFYGKPEYYASLDPAQIDEKRDEFELEIIQKSQQYEKPLLGICRGLQISNVYFGGTLIPDIPSKIDTHVHAKHEGKDSEHLVHVLEETQLHKIVGAESGIINSAHHQSADQIAEPLRLSAWSKEEIVEALEWEQAEGKSFLLLVQWHPERMNDPQGNFSKNIRTYFLEEVVKSK